MMQKRYAVIWFPFLKTDYWVRKNPSYAGKPFVMYAMDHGRMVISAAVASVWAQGIGAGVVVADARAIIPGLVTVPDEPLHYKNILQKLAAWFIRFSPHVSMHQADDILLDATGCAHLWGGEEHYLRDIQSRLKKIGYQVQIAMADTIGAAWACAHFYNEMTIVPPGQQQQYLSALPPASLRIDPYINEKLIRLGLKQTGLVYNMAAASLRRRFGIDFMERLQQALGNADEPFLPIMPCAEFMERLECFNPIRTRPGIEIALNKLLQKMCARLKNQGQGIRKAVFSIFTVNDTEDHIEIGTNRAGVDTHHLFKLFELKIEKLDPGLGIELFTLQVPHWDKLAADQHAIWNIKSNMTDKGIIALADRLQNKLGAESVKRFLPAAHYWPERSVKKTFSFEDVVTTAWQSYPVRPVVLLKNPEPISVTAPVPDYPPMNFRYKGKLHIIKKADGPERIEQEWWLEEGLHRDYFYVEDEDGNRFWVFRSGYYDQQKKDRWFIHGFCA